MTNHRHYFHKIPTGITEVDIYRLIEIIGITCPVAQHVFKKAAAAGQRGHKDLRKDWQDILDSAKRKLEMLDEDDRSKGLDDRKFVMGEVMHSLSGIVLHGHELDTDFDGEHRMSQIGPNGNDGEHYSFIPEPGLKWIVNTGRMPSGLDIRDEVEVIWGYGSRKTRNCAGNFAWGLNGGFGDINLYRVVEGE